MKIIKSILFSILGVLVLLLVNFLLNFIIAPMMNLSWFWLIVTFLIGATFLIPLIAILPGLLAKAISGLRSGNIVEIIIISLAAIYFLISSVATPWVQGASENFKWIITSLFHNIIAIGVYWSIVATLLFAKEK